MMFSQIFFLIGLIILALGSIQPARAQGVATGGSAVPAQPLRAGMKPPTVEYHDIAAQAGLARPA
jgi:hypothetical protein